MQEKLKRVQKRITELSSVAIAFSGGADSSFLLAVAKRSHLNNLLAITVSSAFVSQSEREAAIKIANLIGVKLVSIDVDIFANENTVRNTPNRCYYCKHQLFSRIRQTAESLGFQTLLHGVNLDDLSDYRPGLKAAEELGFISPLADAGLSKKEIRLLSRQLGLETWDKPSQSCLATRIPYYEVITADALARIEAAEVFLSGLGFSPVRVRCHGKMARIETEPGMVPVAVEKEIRKKISSAFKKIGFEHTSIDIDGFRSGKMNHEIFAGRTGVRKAGAVTDLDFPD